MTESFGSVCYFCLASPTLDNPECHFAWTFPVLGVLVVFKVANIFFCWVKILILFSSNFSPWSNQNFSRVQNKPINIWPQLKGNYIIFSSELAVVFCKHRIITKTRNHLSPKMCYIVRPLVSLFSSAAAFKASKSGAMEEVLLREFWFSPLSNLTLMSKQTQRNLMKWRYLRVTGSKLTLYYRCTLKSKKASKWGRVSTWPGC